MKGNHSSVLIPHCLILLSSLLLPLCLSPGSTAAEADAGTAWFSGRAVECVRLRHGRAEDIERDLGEIGRTWRIFSSVRFLRYGPADDGREALLLLGDPEEVKTARMIAEHLDELYSPGPEPLSRAISRIPLEFTSPERVRKELIALSRAAGLNWREDQFLVFPPGRRGGLFFLGPSAEAKKVDEARRELDLPSRSGPLDLGVAAWRAVRRDFFSHFLAVATYAASALALVLLHFALVKLPLLGRRYERWFTLVWTKLLDNVRGRDFALEVIRKIADTALAAAEAESTPLGSSAVPRRPGTGKDDARTIARRLLKFRGFDPDDPEVKLTLDNILQARSRERG